VSWTVAGGQSPPAQWFSVLLIVQLFDEFVEHVSAIRGHDEEEEHIRHRHGEEVFQPYSALTREHPPCQVLLFRSYYMGLPLLPSSSSELVYRLGLPAFSLALSPGPGRVRLPDSETLLFASFCIFLHLFASGTAQHLGGHNLQQT